MSRIGWLDCSSGISGDMLLGALHDVGAMPAMPALIDSLADLGVSCVPASTQQHGIAAVGVTISADDGQPRRGLADVLDVVARCDVPEQVRERAASVFRRIAAVEATIHGLAPEAVQFHEVGAIDSIVDVLGGCLGLHALELDALIVSTIALGAGSVETEHGMLPVPTPATLALLADSGLVGRGGPVDSELATPTGVAVLAEWATGPGPMPAMTVERIGTGAGSRALPDRANVTRLVVGTATTVGDDEQWQVLAANVDDLDPRLWPGVLDALLGAGAADAWLTPILMKKGRPAHTISALAAGRAADAVRRAILAETSTIGVRATAVSKHAAERSWVTVEIDGQQVRVKLAHDEGRRINLAPEFDDVAAAARALGMPAKEILARASAAARRTLDG
jgi:hypothetical protein